MAETQSTAPVTNKIISKGNKISPEAASEMIELIQKECSGKQIQPALQKIQKELSMKYEGKWEVIIAQGSNLFCFCYPIDGWHLKFLFDDYICLLFKTFKR